MDVLDAASALARSHIYVAAAAVGLARMLGVMTVMPAFTRLALTGVLRGTTALALSLPLVPMIAAALSRQPVTLGSVGLVVLKESAIGVIMGVVVGAPIWAAQFAGDLIDTQRGATSGQLTDPSSVEASVTGTLLILAMIALYFGSGGFTLTVGAIYESYALWPVDRFVPLFDLDAGRLFLQMLDQIVTAGLLLAGPLVACLLLIDLLFGLLARAAPQLQAYYLAQSAKNLAFAFLIVVYLAFLVRYMGRNLGVLLETRALLQAIAGPVAR
jgi:type III secretion protein T